MLRDISLRMMLICGIKKKKHSKTKQKQTCRCGEKIGVTRKEEKWGEGKMGKGGQFYGDEWKLDF